MLNILLITILQKSDLIHTYRKNTNFNSVINKNKNNCYFNIFLEKVKGLRINPIHNFLREYFLYYKCYILIVVIFPKKLMLIRQDNQKTALLVTSGIFK